MTVNPYFNQISFTPEQDVYESLIIESIQIHGMDVYYMPRKTEQPDLIFTEVNGSVFESVYTIEMYLKNVLDFRGAGDAMSKFGLQIQDQATFVVSVKRFDEVIGGPANLIRPREGDMIYIPILGEIYKIIFVEHEAIFHSFGKIYTYELDIELPTYDSLVFRTGNKTIDALAQRNTLDRNSMVLADTSLNAILTPDGHPISIALGVQGYDPTAQNENIELVSDDIIDFSELDPFTIGDS